MNRQSGIFKVCVTADNNKGDTAVDFPQLFNQLQSRASGHPDIRNDQIRHRFPCQFPCLDPVMGHTYNLHIQRSPIDQIADQLAYTKLIIHN